MAGSGVYRASRNEVMVVNLKKIHLVVVLIMAIVVPVISIVSAYYTSQMNTDSKISKLRLESEKSYVQKSDIKSLKAKIDKISEDTAIIKGYLEAKKQK